MGEFLAGIATCASWGAAAFFVRFWRETGDRFYALFAIAFLILSLNWMLVAVVHPSAESSPFFYLLRLAAFTLIILAVVDKNRPRR